jgi:sensor histidine kinase YesM
VGIIAMYILYSASTNNFMSRWDVYTNFLIVFAFYIHSLVLLPLITIQSKTKLYTIITLISFFLLTYTLLWFEAMESSEMVTTIDGNALPTTHFFFQPKWLLYGLFTGILVFIPFSLFSLLYHILVMSKIQRQKLFALKYTEAILNVIVSLCLILLTFVNFDGSGDGIVNTFELILLLAVFHLNTFVLIPKFIKTKRYLKYELFVFALFCLFILIKYLFEPSALFITTVLQRYVIPFTSFTVAILLSFTYAFVKSELKAKADLANLKLNSKESELQLLKSQVNPHFLFNTLNTLYATSLKENAPKTAQSIAKLGSLIRYMQNDIHKDLIPLQKEVDYLKDYIEIQKLRIATEPEILASFENIGSQLMSPGLFIPLVENAFKYGIHPTEKSTITIDVYCQENTIHFRCENAYNANQKVHHMEEGFGIGIKNVKQRLQLVYPDKHHFDIDQTDDTFIVELTLQANKL